MMARLWHRLTNVGPSWCAPLPDCRAARRRGAAAMLDAAMDSAPAPAPMLHRQPGGQAQLRRVKR